MRKRFSELQTITGIELRPDANHTQDEKLEYKTDFANNDEFLSDLGLDLQKTLA